MAELFKLPAPALSTSADPISGSQLKFYLTGTSTPASVYSNSALTVSLGSSVPSDSSGRFPAIFLDTGIIYRADWCDASGTVIKSYDPYNPALNELHIGQVGVLESIFANSESLSAFCVQSEDGNYAITGFSRTSDNPNAGSMSTTAGGFFTVNDNTAQQSTSYSVYAEGRPYPGAGRAHVAEFNMVSLRTGADMGPNDTNADYNLTEVLRLSSGRGDVPGSLPISSYLSIVPNGSTGKNGIVFNQDALDSNKQAIVMPEDYKYIFTDRTTGGHRSEFTGTYRYNRVDSNSAWYEETFFRARASGADTQTGDVIGRISFDKFASGVAVSVAYVNVTMNGSSGGVIDLHAKDSAGVDRAWSINGTADKTFGPNFTGGSIGTGAFPVDVYQNRMWIGGALKTLSVDGSGFVKAA